MRYPSISLGYEGQAALGSQSAVWAALQYRHIGVLDGCLARSPVFWPLDDAAIDIIDVTFQMKLIGGWRQKAHKFCQMTFKMRALKKEE